jgi:hypothetical protein
MNQILRRQLTKLVIETRLPWTKCLLLALLSSRTTPPKDIGVSPYEMLYELSHLGQPLGLPSLKPKTSSSKTMYLVSPQSCHPLGTKDYWIRHTHINLEITSWSELGVGKSLSHPGRDHSRFLSGIHRDSSAYHWKRMDPLLLSKVSTPGRALGCVLKTRWYKSNFEKTLLHGGNCITTLSVPWASSPITVKFNARLAILCGDL